MAVKIVLGKSHPKSKAHLQHLLCAETNLWEMIRHMFVGMKRPTETPRNASEVHEVFAFAPPHILCSFCCLWHLPPTNKLLDLFYLFIFFFHLLKHVHLHFKHVREMASVSAAVTVSHRQAGDVCLWATHKIDLATDTVSQGTVAPEATVCVPYKIWQTVGSRSSRY